MVHLITWSHLKYGQKSVRKVNCLDFRCLVFRWLLFHHDAYKLNIFTTTSYIQSQTRVPNCPEILWNKIPDLPTIYLEPGSPKLKASALTIEQHSFPYRHWLPTKLMSLYHFNLFDFIKQLKKTGLPIQAFLKVSKKGKGRCHWLLECKLL